MALDSKNPALSFADTFGRKELADAFGVGLTAVSNSVVRGKFPASWFHRASVLCKLRGIDCPPELFGQKPVSNPQCVDDVADIQGQQTVSVESGAA